MSEARRRSRLAHFFVRLLKEKPLGAFSGMIVLLFILVAIFAEVLAPYPFAEVHPADRLQGASTKYLLGTDHLGRDFLSRLIHGARLSLMVGLAATTLNVGVGVLIGGLSGFIGGKFDLAVQRFVDAWMSFPGLLLLLTIMSIVGRGGLQIIVVLGGRRGHQRLKNCPQRRDWYQRECVFSGSKGDWLHPGENIYPACPAQYCGARHHHFHHQHRRGDYL